MDIKHRLTEIQHQVVLRIQAVTDSPMRCLKARLCLVVVVPDEQANADEGH